METILKIPKVKFKETIKVRLKVSEDILEKYSDIDDTDSLMLDYELWNDYNNNYLKSSFTKEDNEVVRTYNDRIGITSLRYAFNNDIDDSLNKRIEIFEKIKIQQFNLLKIENRIQFLEEISDSEIKQEIVLSELFPLELVKNSRGYIESTAKQAVLCYKHSLFDSSLVMIRKLLETLIIECFEKSNNASKIIDDKGNFLFLSELIQKLLQESTWNLSRNTKDALPKIKKFADLSAHNRRFIARKNDIDEIKQDLRIVIEELVTIAFK